MIVREPTADDVVQGCASLTNNYENTVGYGEWMSTIPFTGTMSCSARKSDPTVEEPFFL